MIRALARGANVKLTLLRQRGGDRFYMAISTAFRMGAGLIVFIVLARTLGPAAYGLFAITMAYAALASLITDFGYGALLLQRIGAQPSRAGVFLNVALRGKTWLVILALPLGVVVLLSMGLSGSNAFAVAVICLGVVLNAYADLVLTGLRSAGHYREEAEELAVSSGAMAVALALCFAIHADLLWSALAFTNAKAIHFYLVLAIGPKVGIRIGGESWLDLKGVWKGLTAGVPYAIDNALTMLSSQIDVLMVGHLFGLETAGVYQIGSRIVLGEVALAIALAGVHLPKAAAMRHGDRAAYHAYEWRVLVEFSVFGFVLALALLAAGPLLVAYVLGPSYAEANGLWPGFAAFVFLRFLAASVGICILVRGHMALRIVNQLVSLFITAGLIFLVSQRGELADIPWAISGATAVAAAIYCAFFAQVRSRP